MYAHLDITAGSGKNAEVGCLGSPLEFAKLAVGFQRQARLICCDNKADRVDSLRDELSKITLPAGSPPWEVYCEDNASLLPRMSILMKGRREFGSLVCDPNGPANGFPREELIEFAAEHQQVDIILTFNVSLYRSIDPRRIKEDCQEAPRKGLATCYERYGTVRSNIKAMPREDWWISNPTNHGGSGHGYLVALGRSMKVSERPCEGFHRLDSEAGQDILDRLDSYHGQLQFKFPKW